jgi:outer membrane protein OmpA-like peptidoglycan-associated protein
MIICTIFMNRFILMLFFVSVFCNIQFGQSKLEKVNLFQNLVVNPSFEQLKSVNNTFIGKIDSIDKVLGWHSPTQNKAMVYMSDSNDNIIDIVSPGQRDFQARSGRNVAAIKVFGERYNNITGHDEEDRSYILGELSDSLKIGQKYYVGFFTHYHCLATNRVGLIFVKDKIKKQSGLLLLKPIMYQKSVINHNPQNIWTIVVDSFIADNSYKKLLIGNFFRSDSTATGGDRKHDHYLAYIDDVFVYEAKNKSVRKEKTPVYLPKSFNNISFEFNSSKLDSNSRMILDSIAKIMVSFQEIKILIKGHTSGEGSTNYNQKLSELRANAIKDYLIKKGIISDKLEAVGFGSSQPLVPDISERNRQINRRIEFEVKKE